jgi:hypothetical protein
MPHATVHAKVPHWRDLAVALSFANLCYLRIWSELLTYTSVDTYNLKHPPAPAEYLAAALNVLLLGAVLWGLMRLVRRTTSRAFRRLAFWAFFVLLLLPLNAIRSVLANQFHYLRSPLLEVLGSSGVALLAGALLLLGLFALLRWPGLTLRGVTTVLLVVSPLVPVIFAQAAWKSLHYDAAPFAERPLAPPLTAAKTSPRIVWVIFDEWDQRLTFPERPSGLRLSEIDRFRKESLHAANAYSPGPETAFSMPALITGRMVAELHKQGPDEELLIFSDAPRPARWSRQPNVFDAARAAGFNTALVGWYHPYCRVIASSLTACWWWPMSIQHNSAGDRFLEILPNQTRSLFETQLLSVFGRSLATIDHTRTMQEILARSTEVVASGKYGLTLLHFPIPHSPHIYDRKTGRFDLKNNPIKGYIDSLALTDLVIGRLRRTMERNGSWDGTTVLFSSDHSFRAAPALDGKKDHRIPFMLKMAGHTESVAFDAPFNTVLTHDLLLAILHGEVATPLQAAAWLDAHRTIGDSPYNYN